LWISLAVVAAAILKWVLLKVMGSGHGGFIHKMRQSYCGYNVKIIPLNFSCNQQQMHQKIVVAA
jgi:hypothetical protein